MNNKFVRVAVLAMLVALVVAFFALDLGQYFSFAYLKSQREAFQAFYEQNAAMTVLVFFSIYVAVTALSIPGAAVMTLMGGFLFGFWGGSIVVSFASTFGATLAFLAARFLMREYVQGKFGDRLRGINERLESEGAFYLFTLRLIPAVPFFVINLVMGLTPMRTGTFFAVSQVGMLPGTMVYVNAGTQLAQLESPAGILSPALIGSFVLLGLFPLIVKKVVGAIAKK